MKRKRFGVEEIIAIVKEGEQGVLNTEELSRKHGVGKSTYYAWAAQFSVARTCSLVTSPWSICTSLFCSSKK